MALSNQVSVWYVCSPVERGRPPPLTDTVSCDTRPFHKFDKFCKEETIMGKGNNSQKNDKKNKKAKKDSKTPASKAADKKR